MSALPFEFPKVMEIGYIEFSLVNPEARVTLPYNGHSDPMRSALYQVKIAGKTHGLYMTEEQVRNTLPAKVGINSGQA